MGGLRFRWDYLVVALKSVTHPSVSHPSIRDEFRTGVEKSDLLLTSELNKVFTYLKH